MGNKHSCENCDNMTYDKYCKACKCSIANCNNKSLYNNVCKNHSDYHLCYNIEYCDNITKCLFCNNCRYRNNLLSNNEIWRYAYKNSELILSKLLADTTVDQDFLNELFQTQGKCRSYLLSHNKFFLNIYSAYLIVTKQISVNLSKFLYKRFLINQLRIHPDINFNLPNEATYKDLYKIHYRANYDYNLHQEYINLRLNARTFADNVKILDFMAERGYQLFNTQFKKRFAARIKKLVNKHPELIVNEESKFFVYCLINKTI